MSVHEPREKEGKEMREACREKEGKERGGENELTYQSNDPEFATVLLRSYTIV